MIIISIIRKLVIDEKLEQIIDINIDNFMFDLSILIRLKRDVIEDMLKF